MAKRARPGKRNHTLDDLGESFSEPDHFDATEEFDWRLGLAGRALRVPRRLIEQLGLKYDESVARRLALNAEAHRRAMNEWCEVAVALGYRLPGSAGDSTERRAFSGRLFRALIAARYKAQQELS